MGREESREQKVEGIKDEGKMETFLLLRRSETQGTFFFLRYPFSLVF
jgi:hypothetical protein